MMFLIPLFYPREAIPEKLQWIGDYNPFALIIEMFRKGFLTGGNLTSQELIVSVSMSLLIFLIGYFWFIRTKKGFTDVL